MDEVKVHTSTAKTGMRWVVLDRKTPEAPLPYPTVAPPLSRGRVVGEPR